MSKRILVKEAGIADFFKSFFKAKLDNKESQWLSKLRKADPKLADIWTDYDIAMNKSMQVQRDILKRRGLDTSKIDDFLKNR
jgi:hypothetical protein